MRSNNKNIHHKTVMILKKIVSALATASILITPLAGGIIAPQPAEAGLWEDIVSPNIDRIRAETVGRAFKQTYISELSSEELDQLKSSQGGDWQSTVTDWCKNKVAEQYDYSVPYTISTWRVERNKVNCYVRELWYK
jgi:hypothetical protein